MPDRFEQSLRVLGLEPGATEQAIKDAYRDLVKVWHPDRFGSDARLREKAQDKLKEINAAFECARGGHQSAASRPRVPDSPAPESPVAHVNHGRAQVNHGRKASVLTLVPAAALAAIVAAGLFLLPGRAPRQSSPAHELGQTPAPVGPARVPAVRDRVTRPPQSTPAEVDAARESTAPTTTGSAPPATGSLVVGSRPMGARVSFDGRVVGETPIVVTDVAPGEHRVEVALEGDRYLPWSSTVLVSAGREEKVLAVLTASER